MTRVHGLPLDETEVMRRDEVRIAETDTTNDAVADAERPGHGVPGLRPPHG